MSDSIFFDTNLFVYAFDKNDLEKREKARYLIRTQNWIISWQVIQEFSNVSIHRFKTPLRSADLNEYVQTVMWPRCTIFPSPDLSRAALKVHDLTQYSYYDSLILASAIASGADYLYTEDLQHERTVESVQILNPFRS